MKGIFFRGATISRVCFAVAVHCLVAELAFAESATGYRLPQFRHSGGEVAAPLPVGTRLRMLADEDFPPFSFRMADGNPAGLAVDLGLSACAEMKVTCSVELRRLDQLLPTLTAGQGEVILDGPLVTGSSLDGSLLTRPWFRSFGRFAVQSGNPLTDASVAHLSGKRIAVQKDSAHAVWLAKYYGSSTIVSFDTATAAQEALRTGAVDSWFGDNLRLIYWVAGTASRGCCKLLDNAFTDFDTFSRNYSLVVARGRDDLRRAFDGALDKLQDRGITEKLFNAYVPLSPW